MIKICADFGGLGTSFGFDDRVTGVATTMR